MDVRDEDPSTTAAQELLAAASDEDRCMSHTASMALCKILSTSDSEKKVTGKHSTVTCHPVFQ